MEIQLPNHMTDLYSKVKAREEILQYRREKKNSQKQVTSKAVTDSVENDTMADKNEVTVVDVVTKNKFETLGDNNENHESPAQHHPEPRLECESSNQASSSSAVVCSHLFLKQLFSRNNPM